MGESRARSPTTGRGKCRTTLPFSPMPTISFSEWERTTWERGLTRKRPASGSLRTWARWSRPCRIRARRPVLFNVPNANEAMFPLAHCQGTTPEARLPRARLKVFCEGQALPLAEIFSRLHDEHFADKLSCPCWCWRVLLANRLCLPTTHSNRWPQALNTATMFAAIAPSRSTFSELIVSKSGIWRRAWGKGPSYGLEPLRGIVCPRFRRHPQAGRRPRSTVISSLSSQALTKAIHAACKLRRGNWSAGRWEVRFGSRPAVN